MFKNKTNTNPSALESELENMEAGATGRLLRSAGQQITPCAEFAQQLEDKFGVDTKTAPRIVPEPIQAYKPQVVQRRGPLLEWSRVRLSLVGVGLSVTMIVVLGLSMFYSGSGRSGISNSSIVPQPTFPPSLGESVLLSQWKQELGGVEIRPVDPATGNTVPGYAPFVIGKDGQYSAQTSLSEDDTRLAVIESRGEIRWPWAGGVSMGGSADVLHLIDVQAWREITVTLSSEQAVGLVTVSADGKRLALNLQKYQYNPNRLAQELVVVDARTGSVLARQEIDIRPSRLEFSLDGARLIVYGQRLGVDPGMDKPDPPRVLLLDAATLGPEWDYTLEDVISGSWCESNCSADHSQQVHASWNPALTRSHDRIKLYIVHADEEKLTTIDFQAHSVRTTEIVEQKSWLEELLALTASSAQAKARTNGATKRAVLSPDGNRLYVTGTKMTAERDPEEEPFGRQVVEVASGRKVATFKSDVTSIRISLDGAYLYLWGSVEEEGKTQRITEVVDAQSLKSVARVEGWGLWSAKTLDGQEVVMSSRSSPGKTEFAMFDPQSFTVIGSWSIDGSAYWLTKP